MTAKSYIIATAGHVDHGKSALVRALTGIDPDRLPEEKARGITIDLGFAYLDLAAKSSDGAPLALRLGIVDVPGHEDFVKNMVAGVGSIDLALLIVAADDGWMPQTEEHLRILLYLGVQRAVVALTKIDLVTGEQNAIAGIREKLTGTPFAQASIVPTSIITGRGIAELKTALAGALANALPALDIGKPRLPVDRAFTLRGVGTVVTGTLMGGTMSRAQSVIVQPSGARAKIRAIQSHNHEADAMRPGARVALNVPDLHVAPRGVAREAGAVGRGDVVTIAGLGDATTILAARLDRSARELAEATNSRPLATGTRVRVHVGSGNTPARVRLLSASELPDGASAYAQLLLERPVFAFMGDRFILRDWSEQQTLAGGKVLDPQTSAHDAAGALADYLRLLDEAGDDPAALVAARLGRVFVADRESVLLQSRFAAERIEQAIAALVSGGKAVLAGSKVVDSNWWAELRRAAAQAIDQHHSKHPEHAGIALADLRIALAPIFGADDEFFELLVNDLARDGFSKNGATVGRAAHQPALPPHLQSAAARIRAALLAHPWDPPSRKELAPDAVSFQAIKFLLRTGEAVEVNGDLVLNAGHYQRAVDRLRAHLLEHGPSSVSDLRQALQTSRRIMVPLLEKLDREGVTSRRGDRRVLREH